MSKNQIGEEEYYGSWEICDQQYLVQVDNESLNSKLVGENKKISSLEGLATTFVDCYISAMLQLRPGLTDHWFEVAVVQSAIFHLDKNNNVSWTIPSTVDHVPLFTSEVFTATETSIPRQRWKATRYPIHVKSGLVFILPGSYDLCFVTEMCSDGELVLTYEGKFCLYCRKVQFEPVPGAFTLQAALEDDLFQDTVVMSDVGRKYHAHKCILHAVFPAINWNQLPLVLSGQPGHIIKAVLKFAYTGLIAEDEDLKTMLELYSFAKKHQELDVLKIEIDKWMSINSVKNKIFLLVDDVLQRISRMTKTINRGVESSNLAATHLSEPSTLLFTLKELLQHTMIGLLSQVYILYLYSKYEKQLSREDRKDILKTIGSKYVQAASALKTLIETGFSHVKLLSAGHIQEFSSYIKEDLLIYVGRVSKYFDNLKNIIESLSQSTVQKHQQEKKSRKKRLMKFNRMLKNAIHIKELKKLRTLKKSFVNGLTVISQMSEQYFEISNDEYRAEFFMLYVNRLTEYVPKLSKDLDDLEFQFEDKTAYKKFKIPFKTCTDHVKWCVDKVHGNKDLFKPAIDELREFINHEEFDKLLQDLDLFSNQPISKDDSKNMNTMRVVPTRNEPGLLSQSISTLYGLKIFSDMEFLVRNVVNDTVESIPAHRVVVAMRCDWFNRAFHSGMKESIDRKFYIEDCSPFLFRLFLKYLYCGHIDLSEVSSDDLVELMTLSDRYEVDHLKKHCQNVLIKSHISDDTALCLLAMASNLSLTNLQDATLKYIRTSPNCCQSEDFEKLPRHIQDIINDIRKDEATKTKDDRELIKHMQQMKFTDCDSDSDTDDDRSSRNDSTSSAEATQCNTLNGRTSLEECIEQLRVVLGSDVSDELLLKMALAADNDLYRAVNFYFEGRFD